jgi:hypothetical protein
VAHDEPMEPEPNGDVSAPGRSWRAVVAWTWAALVTVASLWRAVTTPSASSAIADLTWAVILIALTLTGAFIVHRHPRHTIGWLLLVPGLAVLDALFTGRVAAPPTGDATMGLVVALLVVNFAWLPVFFSIFLLLALFPNGRPLSPAWRWHTRAVVGMAVLLLVWGTFSRELGPVEADGRSGDAWTIANPIGFLPGPETVPWFMTVWSAGLVALTVTALVAMALRFRRAGPTERQQLKWLLAAFTLFAFTYTVTVVINERVSGLVVDALFAVGLLSIPISIAFAILRYRLFDIDVIIRRSVVYAIVAGVLGATYLGSVIAFESLVRGVAGIDSTIGVAASTLLVAALFTPVRRRTHAFVARRFFRARYDATRVLAGFGDTIRDRTDVASFTDDLVAVVATTLQPSRIALWVPPAPEAGSPTTGRRPHRAHPADEPGLGA